MLPRTPYALTEWLIEVNTAFASSYVGEGTGLKISVSSLPSKSLALPNDCSIQSKSQRPCRLKNVFNSSHVIQEEIPVSFAVRLERLTELGPSWPFYQMSSELVSSLSSSLPQTASFSGVSGEFGRRPIWKKKKMRVPEGRNSPQVLGCQKYE